MDTYTDDNGNRVIVRHQGPAGVGIPEGGTTGQILVKSTSTDFDTEWANSPAGTGAAVGPASSTDGNIVLFDGSTGKLLKDSGKALSEYATVSLANTKQDKVTGKGLSTEDFTTELKEKLEALSGGVGYRGSFDDFASIEDETFDPAPSPGDFCLIEASGSDVVFVLWDDTNETWFEFSVDPIAMTGSEIADALFSDDDDGEYVKADCRIFTATEKAQLADLVTLSGSLTGGFQPLDPTLTAFAGLVNTANKVPYFTATDTMAVADFTDYGRGVVGAASYAAIATLLGLGTGNSPTFVDVTLTGGLTTGAPGSSSATEMKFGSVSTITDGSMTVLGFTHQLEIDSGGTSYWVPVKTSAW